MEAKKSKNADLESKRSLFFQIGLILTLIAVFMAFEYKSYDPYAARVFIRELDNTPDQFIEVTVQKKELPPIPHTPNFPITIVDNAVEVDDEPIIDVNAGDGTEIPDFQPRLPEEATIIDNTLVTVPEFDPEFPGGLAKMAAFLSDHIKYPEMARQTGIQGIVYLNFVVEPDGHISNVTVLRGIGGGCDEESVRVVQSMPNWKPGMQFNRKVRVSFNLPVRFTLYH